MQFSFISGIGQPTTAISYELFVIAAVVIGGGSLLGGEGSILGSLIGALIITILYMGGQQMGWPKWVPGNGHRQRSLLRPSHLIGPASIGELAKSWHALCRLLGLGEFTPQGCVFLFSCLDYRPRELRP